jgi:hypothetical protein
LEQVNKKGGQEKQDGEQEGKLFDSIPRSMGGMNVCNFCILCIKPEMSIYLYDTSEGLGLVQERVIPSRPDLKKTNQEGTSKGVIPLASSPFPLVNQLMTKAIIDISFAFT